MDQIWFDLEFPYSKFSLSKEGLLWDKEKLRLVKGKIVDNVYKAHIKTDSGIYRYVNISRLVADTFIPNIENLKSIRHINGNIMDNSVSNLEYSSGSKLISEYDSDYNLIKKWDSMEILSYHLNIQIEILSYHIHYEVPIGDRIFKSTASRKESAKKRKVSQFTLEGTLLNSYESATKASSANGLCCSSISMACRGKTKTSGGYIWKYS